MRSADQLVFGVTRHLDKGIVGVGNDAGKIGARDDQPPFRIRHLLVYY
jgi:hypothetical protein